MRTIGRFRPYAAAYLVLVKDGQILLLRRKNTGYHDGDYGLVSGHFDGRETARQCIIREAKEESGVMINPEELQVVYVMHRLEPIREYFDVYLKVEKWSGEIKNMEPEKCSELRWFSFDNLPDNTIPEIRLALEHIRKGIHYGEFGWPA